MTFPLLASTRSHARDLLDGLGTRRAGEPTPINELVSPLRFDILVRADYFRFLAERLELFTGDFATYVEEAEQHPYFTWFTQVALPRYNPEQARDDVRATEAFQHRLRCAGRLYLSYLEHGFDRRYPITLSMPAANALTSTGKAVHRRLYAGDGCHRLALLVSTGMEVLPADHYRVRSVPQRILIDNTHKLIGLPGLDTPKDYFRFLALGYAGPTTDGLTEVRDESDFLQLVARYCPQRLGEAREVIRHDQSQLAGLRVHSAVTAA